VGAHSREKEIVIMEEKRRWRMKEERISIAALVDETCTISLLLF